MRAPPDFGAAAQEAWEGGRGDASGGAGTGDGDMGGADNLGTEKCALTSRPVNEGVFLVELKEVLRVSKLKGMRKDPSNLV